MLYFIYAEHVLIEYTVDVSESPMNTKRESFERGWDRMMVVPFALTSFLHNICVIQFIMKL